jgi:long-chain acyl-CoA synthetase
VITRPNEHRNVYAALKAVASRRPDAVALVFNNQSVTYRELIVHIEQVAAYFSDIGLRRGESVAAFSQNCPEFMYCFLAAAKLGAVFVPVNYNLTLTEVTYIIQHSEARFLFHDDAVANIGELSLPQGFRHPIAALSKLNGAALVTDAADLHGGDDLLITYTSGSTGTPKAVVHDHASQLNAATSIMTFWGLSADDTTVLGAPLGFLLGLSTITTVSLLVGATIVMNRRFHPGEVLEALVRHRATIFNGVPTMFSMMLEFAEQQNRDFDLSHMRALISSGSPMSDELRKRFARKFGKNLQNYFGMTECYPLFGRYVSDRSDPPIGAVGRVAPGAAIRFVDASGEECPAGNQGELQVRAPATLKRYHKDPALTAFSISSGWFKTGDLGYQDAHGYVFITGRLKDLIKRGGANVAPVEVEEVLLSHSDVQSAAVIGVPDPLYGEVPVAFVVKREGSPLTADTLLAYAAEKLAKFKIPAKLCFEAELPLGRTGKVDKSGLQKRWQELQAS